ncbi:MAG: hypothetical protein KBD46_04100 [Candidatus Levybacteria bacterium]|nr:hypothetical protein [Candidatus Levybacteria bacterium]
MKDSPYITASELGDYVYCKRAWWLRLQGLLSSNQAMKYGQIKHTQLSQWLTIYKKVFALAIALILVGLILTVVALIFMQF